MKKMLLMGIAGLICFSGAAAFSWFALPKPSDDEQVTASQPVESADGDSVNTGDKSVVGLRSSRPASPEQLFRTAALLEKQHTGLVRQREILEQQEGRLKLIRKDMDNYKREINGTYAMLRERIDVGEKLIEQLRSERQQLETLQKQHESQAKVSPGNAVGVDAKAAATALAKKRPRWLGGMDAEQAAKVLREMSDDGKMDLVVQMLTSIDERTASKILDALNDPPLVAILMQKKMMANAGNQAGIR